MKQTHSVALAALLSVVLVGCSDNDPQPKITPSPPSSSSSPTAPPTTAPPEPSETAVALSPEDTVRAWVEARNQALRTGKTQPLRDSVTPGCSACEPFIEPIEAVYQAGGHYETRGWTVESSRVLDPAASEPEVDIAITIAGGRTFASKGEPPTEYGPEKEILRLRLKAAGNVFLVSFVGFLS